jgi:hypothetical protein
VLRARSSDMSRVVEVPALEAAPSLPSGKDEFTHVVALERLRTALLFTLRSRAGRYKRHVGPAD